MHSQMSGGQHMQGQQQQQQQQQLPPQQQLMAGATGGSMMNAPNSGSQPSMGGQGPDNMEMFQKDHRQLLQAIANMEEKGKTDDPRYAQLKQIKYEIKCTELSIVVFLKQY